MIVIAKPTATKRQVQAWHDGFLRILPAIKRFVEFAFRELDPESKAEAVAEAIAAAFVSYAGLVRRGLKHRAYPSTMARYAINHVRNGRHVGGHENNNDVLSRSARRRHGFHLKNLKGCDWDLGPWREAIIEDYATPVLDQVAFRIDVPHWLSTLSERDRRMALTLAEGERTKDVAKQFGVSCGRVSQLRNELAESWAEFQGDVV